MKRIIAIIGPSASGKTTLGHTLKEMGIVELISSTSRNPRPKEVEGVDYYFAKESDFFTKEFIEKNYYAGHWYGLSKKEVDSKLQQHDVVFCIVDEQGWKALKAQYKEQVVSIGIRLSKEESKRRMQLRHDDEVSIARRLLHFDNANEGSLWQTTDYWIDGHQSKEKMIADGKEIVNKIIELDKENFTMAFIVASRVVEGKSKEGIDLSNMVFCRPCTQDGWNQLYDIGQKMFNDENLSKYEIVVFNNNYFPFFSVKLDDTNFNKNPYSSEFLEVVTKEYQKTLDTKKQKDSIEENQIQQQLWFSLFSSKDYLQELAAELNEAMLAIDPYEYRDQFENTEEGYEYMLHSITNDIKPIKNYLYDYLYAMDEYEIDTLHQTENLLLKLDLFQHCRYHNPQSLDHKIKKVQTNKKERDDSLRKEPSLDGTK